MAGLREYRDKLAGLEGGTVPTALALEIIDAGLQEVAAAETEYTLTDACALSGRSRSFFERRLAMWEAQGLARRSGRTWLLKRGTIPARRRGVLVGGRGYDPALTPEELADALLRKAS